jgi:hypothetical protein
MVPPALITKFAGAVPNGIGVGVFGLIEMPVSPPTPRKLIVCAFVDGGMMITALGVTGTVGTVIVLLPTVSCCDVVSSDAGFRVATVVGPRFSDPVVPPVSVIVTVTVDVPATPPPACYG